jgi:hypothetical protein
MEAVGNIENAVLTLLEHKCRWLGAKELSALAAEIAGRMGGEPGTQGRGTPQFRIAARPFLDGPADVAELEALAAWAEGQPGRKALFIAPAGFTPRAEDYACGHLQVRAVDGAALARLMYVHDALVTVKETVEIFGPDPAYFGEDAD